MPNHGVSASMENGLMQQLRLKDVTVGGPKALTCPFYIPNSIPAIFFRPPYSSRSNVPGTGSHIFQE